MPRSDSIYIGAVPPYEDCQQVGMPECDYQLAKKESEAYRRQLARQFPKARLVLKSQRHDIGTEYFVEVLFDSEEEMDIAMEVESKLPDYWDEQSLRDFPFLTTTAHKYSMED